MDNDLILEIDNVGPIYHAKIDIGKINIISGKNSTGKSTSSKLLYCFLKASSSIDGEVIFDNVLPLFDKMMDTIDCLEDYVSVNDFKIIENLFWRFSHSFRGQHATLFVNKFYEFSKKLDEIILKNKNKINQNDPRWKYFQTNYQLLKDYVSNTLDNPRELYISSLMQLIDSEFNIREPSDFGGLVTLYSENAKIRDEICFENYSFNHESSYPIDNIFYLDSFSILDDDINGLLNIEHIQSLIKSLYEYYYIRPGIDDDIDKIIKKLETEINHIIGGGNCFTS